MSTLTEVYVCRSSATVDEGRQRPDGLNTVRWLFLGDATGGDLLPWWGVQLPRCNAKIVFGPMCQMCLAVANSACIRQKLSTVQWQPDKRREASITSPTDVGDTRGGVIGGRCGVIGGVKNRGVVSSRSGVNLT